MGIDPGLLDVAGHLKAVGGSQMVQAILLWQVLAPLFTAMEAPAAAKISQTIWAKFPDLQLSIADAVEAVVKGHLTMDEAVAEVALSGIDAKRFQTLYATAGEPPALDFLAEAMRRGFIERSGTGPAATSLEQGIRESRLKDKWIPVIEQMQWHLAPVGTLIEGWLRGQITEREALALLAQNGIDEFTGRLMYKSAGRPPGPMELIELHRRGVIPEAGEGGDTLSLRQGYLETDLKNKWYESWLRLAEYLPPPRTVTALLRQGTITDDEALRLFQEAGLSAHLAGVYVAAAHHERAHATKELTKADLLGLYMEGVFSRPEALAALEKLGYDGHTAEFELEAADFHRTKGLIDRAVARVHGLYVTHKINKTATVNALDELGIPHGQRDQLLQVWELERADNVAVLTPAEVVHLVKLQIISEGEALARLAEHGFGARDAWLRLALGLGGAPDTPPPSA